jgi:outer membrane protein assembly factor BamB
MRALATVLATLLAACSSTNPATDDVTCGPGTEEISGVCLPIPGDGGLRDAAPADAPVADAPVVDVPADAAVPDAAPDAAVHADEAPAFAIDPAHDNAQPGDSIASPLAPAWTATFTGAVSYPIVAAGLVIVSAAESPPTIRALDVNTGALVWGPIVVGESAMLAYDQGRIFTLDFHGRLAAFDVITGAQQWIELVYPGAYDFPPPVATGGTIYLNRGSFMSAYDEQTGMVLWLSEAYEGSDGCPAVGAGTVYQAGSCDELYAWNAITGTQLWSHLGTCSGGGGAAPSVYGGKVWERDDVLGNVIYDQSGTIVGQFASDAVPAFDAGKVFYQAAGNVKAINLMTNATAWTFAGDGQLCTSPVVAGAGGQVFVGSRTGKVYELDEATGAQRSVHDVGTALTCFSETNTITLGEGHLLVPAGNQLIAY